MLLDADLHLHSRFSIASSRTMVPDSILAGCRRKGIAAIGSGDALHGVWREMWREAPPGSGILVIPSAEVEDRDRVHHLILAESFGIFDDLFCVSGENAGFQSDSSISLHIDIGNAFQRDPCADPFLDQI